jgi:hypothetical protein
MMQPAVTFNGRALEDIDPHEFEPMVADTLSQLENIRNNETIERAIDEDEYGIDQATD